MYNIQPKIPSKTNILKKNDIIFGIKEFNNGRWKNYKKEIVEVGILSEDACNKYDEYTEIIYSKGKEFSVKKKIDLSCIDNRENSIWVIIDVISFESYIVGEIILVTAQKMRNDNIDENGEVIQFVTKGFFPIKTEFEVIGELKKNIRHALHNTK